MPTQTYPYLALSDGTTTVEFQNGSGTPTNWQLAADGWTPAIPAYNPSALAGRGQYADVVETFTINVRGSTAADCYTNLDTLARLLDQAERWWLGENVTAVLLKCAPQGSTLASTAAPLMVAVKGRGSGDQTSGVRLSPRWNDAGKIYEISGVQVQVARRGLWLLDTDTAAATTNNGSLATVPMNLTLNLLGPTKLDMSGYPSATTDKGFFVVSSNDTLTRIAAVAPAGGASGNWTSVNDSANFAQHTNILRFTPAGTTEDTSGSITSTITGVPLIAVFANVRNNSTTTSFYLRAQVLSSGGYISAYTPQYYIAPSASAMPGWVLLGFVALPNAAATMKLLATASAASGSLDIGAIVLVDVAYAGTCIVTYQPTESNALVKNLVIDHASLTLPVPTTLGTYPFTIEGDMAIMTKAANLVMANLITSGSSNDWRQTSLGSVVSNTFTITRYRSYLHPV